MDTKNGLTVLTRLASRNHAALPMLEHALAGRLSALGAAAIEVAIETGDPMGVALNQVIQHGLTAELAEQLRLKLPDASVALRETAVELERRSLDSVVADGTAGVRKDIALRLNRLAFRLREVDRIDDALNISQQAVQHARELVKARPGYEDEVLASCLDRLSYLLRSAGRPMESLDAADEAVEINRKNSNDDVAGRSRLASALDNLGNALEDAGRGTDAVAAGKEAVALYSKLAQETPGGFRASYAGSLMHLAKHHMSVRQYSAALPISSEAVELHRELANRSPDMYMTTLASSLNVLSGILVNLGRTQESLVALDEVTEIYRGLAALRPQVFQSQLASMMLNRAAILRSCGDDGAFTAAQQAVEVMRPLASDRPDMFAGRLAGALGHLAAAFEARKELVIAAGYYEKGLVVLAAPFLQEPNTTSPIMLDLLGGYLRVAGKIQETPSYSRLVMLLVEMMGPFIEAEAHGDPTTPVAFKFSDEDSIALPKLLFEEFLAAARRLVDEPAVRQFAVSAGRALASVYGEHGDVESACAIVDQITEFANDSPGDAYLRHELAVALQDIVALLLRECGDGGAAMSRYNQLKQLALDYPDERQLRKSTANSTVTLLTKPENLNVAEGLYEDVRAFANAEPADLELAQCLAKCSINMIVVAGEAGYLDIATRAHDELERQAARWARSDFRGWLAMARFNLINASYAPRKMLAQAQACYDSLALSASVYPDESVILTSYSTSLEVLTRAYAREGRLESAEQILMKFSSSMPVDDSCRLARAECLAVLVAAAAQGQDFSRALRLYRMLSESVETAAYREDFAHHQALAGVVLAFWLGKEGRANEEREVRQGLNGNAVLAQHTKQIMEADEP